MTANTPCFLEFDSANTRNPRAPYAVLPVPYERTVSYGKGTGSAPDAILRASEQLELFDEELFCRIDTAVQTLEAPDCDSGDEKTVMERIYEAASGVLAGQRFLMTLGGEHSISSALVRAAAEHIPDICVLHIDAHADLRDAYEGNALSHASVMRRIADIPVDIVHVGIRSLSEEDYDVITAQKRRVFWAGDIVNAGDFLWINDVVEALGRNVYISLDIDALDTSLAPGTGTPEPGGLRWYECLKLLREVCSTRNVVAADVVEVMPIPGSFVSEFTAAKLAVKIMMYHKHKPDAPERKTGGF